MMESVYALIHEAGGSFGISFPDFPGVVSGGRTIEEALARGRETLAFHVEGMIEDGEAFPSLRQLDGLRQDADFVEASRAAIVVLVPFDPHQHLDG